MSTVMQLLHTGLVWLVVSVITVVGAILAIALSPLPCSVPAQLRLTRWWAKACVWCCGCRLQVEGLESLEQQHERYIIMANHQSAFDIPVLLAMLPVSWQVSVWAKHTLFKVPMLGWAMRSMGFVSVDRQQRSSATRMLKSSLRMTNGGRSALIFPEETYSEGGKLLPFQRGGFLLAFRSGLPILPIGIQGTADVLAPGAYLLRPATVTVRIGAPVTSGRTPISQRSQISDQVRRTIAQLSRLDL